MASISSAPSGAQVQPSLSASRDALNVDGEVAQARSRVEQGVGENDQPERAQMSASLENKKTATDAAQSQISEVDKDTEYPELDERTTLQPPPDFKPFFTLIEDLRTGEHHHPHVHYIFADDDPDILTSAALDALHADSVEAGSSSERIVVVDMAADGREVVSTASLSSRWQGVRSSITQAPSWGSSSLSTQQMLRISGEESTLWQRNRDTHGRKGDVSALIKTLDETQVELESVIGRAGGDAAVE